MPEAILVVDDQPELRLLIRLTLQTVGKVAVAGSSAEMRERIAAERPRVIVLDVSLGHENGLEICSALKADPGTRDIRILLLSAFVQEADIAAGKAAGADHYMAKPFAPRDLQAAVAALLA
ncbi:MAG: response regulator [Pseudomonadota bacterium]